MIRLMWLKIGISVRLLLTVEMSWLVEELSACTECSCSIKLIGWLVIQWFDAVISR